MFRVDGHRVEHRASRTFMHRPLDFLLASSLVLAAPAGALHASDDAKRAARVSTALDGRVERRFIHFVNDERFVMNEELHSPRTEEDGR